MMEHNPTREYVLLILVTLIGSEFDYDDVALQQYSAGKRKKERERDTPQ